MHRYHLQFQQQSGTALVLRDTTITSDMDKDQFVAFIAACGWWFDKERTQWIAPGCIQGVLVIA